MGRSGGIRSGQQALARIPSTVSATVLGYGMILVIVAFFRELFGSGTLLGYQIVPETGTSPTAAVIPTTV